VPLPPPLPERAVFISHTLSREISFFDEITYHDIEKIDVGLDEKKKASIDAVRYSAMPLTLLCNLQDEDAIDAILDAREKDVIENGWKISCKTSDEGNSSHILITIEYTDK
jgi:hypothetical protein